MLERFSSPAGDGSLYGRKYVLDDAGNGIAFELFQNEQTRGGDRRFDEVFTATGTVKGDVMSVQSICITPKEKNPAKETFCRNATETKSEGSTSGTTGVPSNAETS